jgi:hypothetical protein
MRFSWSLPISVLLFSGLFSGCLGGAELEEEATEGSGSLSQSQTEAPKDVKVSDTTGAIQGVVASEEGVPLRSVHISVLNTNHYTRSDGFGRFSFEDLPARVYGLRFDVEGYKSFQQDVSVAAAKVTIVNVTMVSIDNRGLGYKDHFHDLWGEESVIKLFDRQVEYSWSVASGGEQGANVCLKTPLSVNTALKVTLPSCWTINFWLDDDIIVPPGTDHLVAKLDWKTNPYVQSLRLRWQTANDTIVGLKGQDATLAAKEPLVIPVEPAMADHGHQKFSLWAFEIRLEFTPAAGVAFNFGDVIRREVGPIAVRIDAFKGVIPPEPPHTKYWVNGSVVQVLSTERSIGGGTRVETGYERDPRGLTCPTQGVCFAMTAGRIVPPGTTQVNVTMEVAYGTPGWEAVAAAKRLAFRTAEVQPRYASLASLRVEEPVAEAGKLVWRLKVTDKEIDSFYQKNSFWLLFLANKGEEREPSYMNDCPGPCNGINVKIHVEAYNADWKASMYDFKS